MTMYEDTWQIFRFTKLKSIAMKKRTKKKGNLYVICILKANGRSY